MILSAQSIRAVRPLMPLVEASVAHGLTFGLGPASYDVRIAEALVLPPGGFALASTMERFDMPHNIAGSVKDKSTWARRGLAVQNTWIDPGWAGFLTLELSNHHQVLQPPSRWCRRAREEWRRDMVGKTLVIAAGCPIAQIVFERLDQPTELPYKGKYQHQQMGPVKPRISTEEAAAEVKRILDKAEPDDFRPMPFDGEER